MNAYFTNSLLSSADHSLEKVFTQIQTKLGFQKQFPYICNDDDRDHDGDHDRDFDDNYDDDDDYDDD